MAPLSRARIRIGAASIDVVTASEVADHIVASIKRKRGGVVVTPNVDHLRLLERDARFAGVYDRASLIVADGMPVLWLSRILRTALPERIAGSDLLFSLSAAAAKADLSVFLCGGREGMAEAASIELIERTEVRIAATSAPKKLDVDDDEKVNLLAQSVKVSGADIVYLAFGAPKQEILADKLSKLVPGVWFLGVGGSFEMAANLVSRAPSWVQRLGFEWMFRLTQEPGRLCRRYLLEDLPFLFGLTVRTCLARARGTGVIETEVDRAA